MRWWYIHKIQNQCIHICQVTRFPRVTPGNRACHPHFPWTPVGTRISLRCRYALWPSFSFRNEGHDPDLVFHRLAGYSIGFFLKPIMKRWQVLHIHNFFILINRVSLRKDLGYNLKKIWKKMLMLDYHSVQCS
jgi:hypothetical protein